jgi:hypothetical protein
MHVGSCKFAYLASKQSGIFNYNTARILYLDMNSALYETFVQQNPSLSCMERDPVK